MNAVTAPQDHAPAVIVVWDADLAVALEMSMIGAGFGAFLPDAAADLSELLLNPRSPLIVSGDMLPQEPHILIDALRAAGWRGLGVVITQNAESWARRLAPADRFVVLEMPFMSHDLINIIVRDGVASEHGFGDAANQLILGSPEGVIAAA